MRKEKSFTLIELMVAIALMGLIATIVLVSLRGARERARIAASLQFSNSIRASLSDALVSWWNFNEGAGGTVGDTWGRNNGTILGASWTKGVAGNALSFDGSNDCVRVNDNPSLNFGATESFTIETWVRTSETGTVQRAASKYYGGSGYFLGIQDAAYDNAVFYIRGGGDAQAKGTTRMRPGVWHHIVGVRDVANGLVRIYVDGVEEGSGADGTFSSIGTDYPLYIGCFHGFDDFFGGTIDEVRIYNRSFTAFEIQKRYAEGLKKFKLVKE